MVKCKKCKVNFSSVHNLEKHLNREFPCDVDITCNKCEKIFYSKQSLKTHLNKKNPCKSKVDEITNKELELKLAIEQEKTKRMLELAREKEESDKRKMERDNNRHLNRMKEEMFKTERKEKTAQVINNNIINATYNNTYNNIVQVITENHLPTNQKQIHHLESMSKTILKGFFTPIMVHESMFENSKNITEIIESFLKYTFNNPKIPEERCIFYCDEDIKDFIGIFKTDSGKEVKKLKFHKEIYPQIQPAVVKFLTDMINVLPIDRNKTYDPIKLDDVKSTLVRLNDIKNSDLENASKSAFNQEDLILPKWLYNILLTKGDPDDSDSDNEYIGPDYL